MRLEKLRDAQEGGSEGCRLTLVFTFCVPLELSYSKRSLGLGLEAVVLGD